MRRSSRTIRWVGAIDQALKAALDEIVREYPWRFSDTGSVGVSFSPIKAGDATSIAIASRGPETLIINYRDLNFALRALGIVMGKLEGDVPLSFHDEQCDVSSRGVMIDSSRNAVFRVETVKKILRGIALMGLNQLLLYTEDTYEVPGEPIFGYFRGGYSQAELKEIDDYAFIFNIEVIPCIQTLGHLEQVIKWPAFRDFVDTESILLVGDEGTKKFVAKLVEAAAAPFRSKKIHIGMDEAHGVGSGVYRNRNGHVEPFELMTTHLKNLVEICEEQGLSPMIWSDMFFRLGSKSNDYYDIALEIPPEIPSLIPENLDLVYWDYEHLDKDFYATWIAKHRALGKEPIFAAGIWTWSRFWAALPRSFALLKAGVSAANEAGLKSMMVTIWGDDGAECDFFSALPAVQYFSELVHFPAGADENLGRHFRGSCNASCEAWVMASQLDHDPSFGTTGSSMSNLSKWLLWHDPIMNFLDRLVPLDSAGRYAKLSGALKSHLAVEADARLLFPLAIAEVLDLKCELHIGLRAAYRNGNEIEIVRFQSEVIPLLKKKLEALRIRHEALWRDNNKVFGWDVIERRYAGLSARLVTLESRLWQWLRDPSFIIEELELDSCDVYANVANASIGYRMSSGTSPFC